MKEEVKQTQETGDPGQAGILEEIKKHLDERFDRLEALELMKLRDPIGIKEAALFIGYSTNRVYYLMRNMKLPYYRQGDRLYFKKADLEKWMTENRFKSQQEIEDEADTYVTTKSRVKKKMGWR